MRNSIAIFPLLLLAGALGGGCAANPKALISDGQAALSQKQFARAATAFKEAQLSPGITQLDRDAAEVGEVKAFLGKGDLVGAEARLRRMNDPRSAKWYYLGEVAVGRGDLAAAQIAYREALKRTHGGDTATKLARLMAGEARRFEAFNEAAAVLKGFKAEADALREAANVWRAHLGGRDPGALLARLKAVESPLTPYPAARVLLARLLDAAGKTQEAESAWNLAALDPPPTAPFVEFAKTLRARLAIERGDSAALSSVLEGADVATAGRVRNGLANSRLWRGDVEGALALWRETAKAGGDPAHAAAAAVASHLERLGQSAAAKPYWAQAEKALAANSSSKQLRRALAQRRARAGDLLDGCSSLSESTPAADDSPAARRAADLLRAGELLRKALEAHANREDGLRDSLAQALLLLVPLEPVALQFLGVVVDGAPDATGVTQLEHHRAELVRSLRAGDVHEVREIVRWSRQQRVDGALPEALLKSFEDTLERELHGGLREALRLGRKKDAQGLLKTVSLDPKSATLAELRACSCLASLELPAPRELRALPEGTTHWGSIVLPALGMRLPRVGVTREGPTWTLRLPGQAELRYATVDALEAALGGSLNSAEWTRLHEDYDVHAAEQAVWRERWPAWPRVEVR